MALQNKKKTNSIKKSEKKHIFKKLLCQIRCNSNKGRVFKFKLHDSSGNQHECYYGTKTKQNEAIITYVKLDNIVKKCGTFHTNKSR